jgi:ligand-binding SRPBCC domain-containing protein
MNFRVTSGELPKSIYEGLMISYKVSPILHIPITWVTEITHIKPKQFFVDEQRVGPYAIWHHEHHFEEVNGKVLMKDIVSYQPPFGVLGDIAQKLFIKHQLESIFEYRTQAVEQIFGKVKA